MEIREIEIAGTPTLEQLEKGISPPLPISLDYEVKWILEDTGDVEERWDYGYDGEFVFDTFPIHEACPQIFINGRECSHYHGQISSFIEYHYAVDEYLECQHSAPIM